MTAEERMMFGTLQNKPGTSETSPALKMPKFSLWSQGVPSKPKELPLKLTDRLYGYVYGATAPEVASQKVPGRLLDRKSATSCYIVWPEGMHVVGRG